METEQIVSILCEKRRLFLRFFEISQQMCTDSIELLEQEMQERLQLQAQIEALDAQLQLLYRTNPAAEEAAKNKCDYSRLTPENAKVYDAALQMHGVLFQIQQLEPQLHARLVKERDTLLEKLESSQKSPAAAAHRYYQSAHLESPISHRSPHFGNA